MDIYNGGSYCILFVDDMICCDLCCSLRFSLPRFSVEQIHRFRNMFRVCTCTDVHGHCSLFLFWFVLYHVFYAMNTIYCSSIMLMVFVSHYLDPASFVSVTVSRCDSSSPSFIVFVVLTFPFLYVLLLNVYL